MKRSIRSLLVSLFLTSSLLAEQASAQVGPFAQDPFSHDWKTIENDFVKIIYPDFLKDKAQTVAHLVEHYAKVVGLSYGIQNPKKVTLILRSEVALPNGFVTLMPRRTEWYATSSFTPLVGTSSWYQSLAIHEYRHVNQFDYFDKNAVSFLDYAFGDMGKMLAIGLSLPAWYMEGDAVYAETKYTDAGRGREPEFLARLKAIVLSKEGVPTYDQFLNGSSHRPLPNHYVYGYVLVTEAYKRFGDKFWSRVLTDVSEFPIPTRFEYAFRRASGISFETFYNETFSSLKEEWQKKGDASESRPSSMNYAAEWNPKILGGKTYYVSSSLDELATIRSRGGDSEGESILEIPFSSVLTPIDFAKDKAVYNETRPHWRYEQKGSSDLALIDLRSGEKSIITDNGRYYNAKFTADGERILATEFVDAKTFRIVELDLSGKHLRQLEDPNYDLVEAVGLSGDQLVVLANTAIGEKTLLLMSFEKGLIRPLLEPTRNAISHLKSDGDRRVTFQAQWDGRKEVFLFDAGEEGAFKRCTDSEIGVDSPSFSDDGQTLAYSNETARGMAIKTVPVSSCASFTKEDLTKFAYLGKGPSDNFLGEAPYAFPNQKEVMASTSGTTPEADYNRFDGRAFTPHSWNFFVGRGFGLEVLTNNYLNDFGMNLALGEDADDDSTYKKAQIDFRMFPVTLSLLASESIRSAEIHRSDFKLQFRERDYGGRLAIPFFYKRGIHSLGLLASYQGVYAETARYRVEDIRFGDGNRNFAVGTAQFSFSLLQDKAYRAITPPWGLTLVAQHDKADPRTKGFDAHSNRVYGDARVYVPGFFVNHGMRFGFSGEENTKGFSSYEHTAPSVGPSEYVFSRGYDYETIDRYSKSTFDYIFPLSYPEVNWGKWIYLGRVSMNVFYDYTSTHYLDMNEELASTGVEAIFDLNILRTLPIQFGIRAVHRISDDTTKGEGFLGTDLAVF